jgi:predicted aspartyl protease
MAVPLTHDDKFYTLQVVVDSTPLTFLFDCGFNGNIAIDRSHADALGIRGIPDRVSVGVGRAETDTTHLNRFTLGTMHLDSQFVKIITEFPNEGALGASFASAHNAIIDYTNDVLYVQDSLRHSFTLLPGSVKHQGDVVIPLMRVATKGSPVKVVYIMKAFVDSMPVTLLLDTGAGHDLIIDQHRADGLGLHATSTELAMGVGGIQTVHSGRIGRLTLGIMHLDSFSFVSMDLSGFQQRFQSDGLPKIDGVLGAGVLNDHGAIIDFGQGMMYLHSK